MYIKPCIYDLIKYNNNNNKPNNNDTNNVYKQVKLISLITKCIQFLRIRNTYQLPHFNLTQTY